MFKREIAGIIDKQLYQGKIILIFGARRVGKTTYRNSCWIKALMADILTVSFWRTLQRSEHLIASTFEITWVIMS